MPPEYVKAACDEAHSHGFIVAAHVESPEGVRVALENGVDTIEHGAKADDEIISLFKKRHAALITTLSPALPYALFDRSVSHATELSQYNGKVVFEGIIDCAENALRMIFRWVLELIRVVRLLPIMICGESLCIFINTAAFPISLLYIPQRNGTRKLRILTM